MRYIGNKTRLLSFILRTLERERIPVGSVHDAFAGTASVGRALKCEGWGVHSRDLLMSSYAFQRAYIVADSAASSIGDMSDTREKLASVPGLITQDFFPDAGRASECTMYVRP